MTADFFRTLFCSDSCAPPCTTYQFKWVPMETLSQNEHESPILPPLGDLWYGWMKSEGFNWGTFFLIPIFNHFFFLSFQAGTGAGGTGSAGESVELLSSPMFSIGWWFSLCSSTLSPLPLNTTSSRTGSLRSKVRWGMWFHLLSK